MADQSIYGNRRHATGKKTIERLVKIVRKQRKKFDNVTQVFLSKKGK